MNKEILEAHAKEALCIWWLTQADYNDLVSTMRGAVALSRLPSYVYSFFLKRDNLPHSGYFIGGVWYPRNLSIDVKFNYDQQAIQEPQTLYSYFGNAVGVILPRRIIRPPMEAQNLPGILTNFEGEMLEAEALPSPLPAPLSFSERRVKIEIEAG